MKFSHLLLVGSLITGWLWMTPLLADEASDKKMTEKQYESLKYLAKKFDDSLAQALLGAFYVQGMYGSNLEKTGVLWLEKSASQENVFALKALIDYHKDDAEKDFAASGKYKQNTPESRFAHSFSPNSLEPQPVHCHCA